MIERLDDMPDGTAGFRFSGEVTKRDYDEVLLPALREAIEKEEPIRALCLLGPEFEGYEAGAAWADLKTGAQYGIGHHSAWRRMALVTDVEWVRHLTALFGWMSPGEMRVFPLAGIEDAKAWISG